MAEQKNSLWQTLYNARGWVALLAILLAALSSYYFWKHPKVVTVANNVYIPVPANPQVIIKEKIVPVDHIVIIEKPGVPNLPDEVVEDTHKQVTAVGTVPSYEGNTSVAAIITLPEGKTTLMLKREPLPFFAFRNKGYLDVGYGLRNWNENYSTKITWEYGRVGKAILWASIEQNSRPETIGMVGVRIPLWN
jgi:hypothetical protein